MNINMQTARKVQKQASKIACFEEQTLIDLVFVPQNVIENYCEYLFERFFLIRGEVRLLVGRSTVGSVVGRHPQKF